MKIIVAHPARQHSFQTATALEKNGMLYAYITTIYQKPKSFTNLISRFLPIHSREKAKSRYSSNIPIDKVILFDELFSLICLFLSKIKVLKKLHKWLYLKMIMQFGKKVARYAIINKVDAVIMYDETSVACFTILKEKAPHIKRILDVSTVNRLYIKEIYTRDMMIYNHTLFKKYFSFLWAEKYMTYCKNEIELTDYFIFPSQFVKNSYLFSEPQILNYQIIPYGVDLNKFRIHSKSARDKLVFIFVGQISLYKGLHHLLSVISKMDKNQVELFLIGSIVNKELYIQYAECDNIHFEGFISHSKIESYYDCADVFVFPTLGEGFGLVVLEALANGLPVVCSQNAGGNDAIIDNYNGFVFNPLDEEALRNNLQWFVDNKIKINKMRKNARDSAKLYSWDRYYKSISNYVKTICKE